MNSTPPMKITFKDEALSELYETGKTKDSKYKRLCKDNRLVEGYRLERYGCKHIDTLQRVLTALGATSAVLGLGKLGKVQLW